MKNWSIKTRVSLFYSAFLLGIAALMIIFLFLTTDSAVQNVTEERLQQAVREVANGISYFDDRIEIDPDFDFYAQGATILLYGPQGTSLAGTAPTGFPSQVPLVSGTYQTVQNGNDHWMVYDLLVSHPDATSLWIRGIYLTDNTVAAIRLMHRVALIALPSLFLAAVVGGWLVTKKAFAPVDRIRQAAAEISAGNDLTRRIQLPAHRDELYQLTETLNQMMERLQKAFENERQFSSDVSHELRTPIAVILSYCDYALDREHTPEEYRKALENIRTQSRRMSSLCAQLLELSQNLQAAGALQKEEVNLALLCDSICEELSTAAEKRGIRIFPEFPEDLEAQVDETQWMRLLINLINNAIRYGRENGEIHVRLFAVPEEASSGLGRASGTPASDTVVLQVADDGPGIPPEKLDKIFTRFYQADESRAGSKSGGFGLGLSYVKWIAEAHGGTVSVESQLGKGTTFTVRIPRGEATTE